MGWFDKITKAAGKVANAATEISIRKQNKEQKAEQKRLKAEQKAQKKAAKKAASQAAPVQSRAQSAEANAIKARMELEANLSEILAAEYPGYEVRQNVDVKTIDAAQEFGGPADFALLSDGRVVGAIMIVDKGKKRTKRVHGVERACQNTGAGFANFYTSFNDPEYFPFSRAHAVAYLKKQIN